MTATRLVFIGLCTILAAIALPTNASAGWPALSGKAPVTPSGSSDAALIVSIEDYAFLPDVSSANKNAAEWERFLQQDLGIETVITLSDSDAVREQILLSAERVAGSVGEGGTLWFVFIGHGAPTEKGEGVLIGADGQQNVISIAARGVSQAELVDRFNTGAQDRTVMLLDACFSGRDRSGGALAKGTMPVVPVADAVVADNLVVLTAADSDQVAGDLPEIGRPAFSYLMLGALRGWADDGDGDVTVNEAVTFARRELLGVPGRRQTPQFGGDGGFVLTRGATEPRPASSDVTVQTGNVVADERHSDGVGDWPIYVSLHAGFGPQSTASDVGLVGLATAGVKLNAFGRKSPREWRLGARFNVYAPSNPDAPSYDANSVTFLENSVTGADSALDDNDNVVGARSLTLFAGPQFGYGWRTERAGRDDSVIELDVFGGVAPQFDVCSDWELDTANNEASCEARGSALGFGGGAGFQAQWSILEVGVQASYLGPIGMLLFASVGLSIDP